MTVSVPKEPLPDVSHVVRILFSGVRIVTEVAKLHDSVKFPYCLPIMPEHNKNKIGQLPTPRHVLSDKVPVKDSLAWLQAVLNFLDYVAAFLVLFHVSHVHLAVIMQLSHFPLASLSSNTALDISGLPDLHFFMCSLAISHLVCA